MDVYGCWEKKVKSRDFLIEALTVSVKKYFGISDKQFIRKIADNWMDDANHSLHRFETIRKFLPRASKILDMSSGCGTCVYCGLLNGFNMYGIEPEQWKHDYCKMKATENKYPLNWQERFSKGIGEALPYYNDFFDCVTTYQTLEHVNDPDKCISEMIRVTKPGGGIHIHCPDYRASFEAHYLLPWLPLFPRQPARIYLKIMKRPEKGLTTLTYVTTPKIKKSLLRHSKRQNKRIEIVDVNECYFINNINRFRFSILLSKLYPVYRSFLTLKTVFRQEFSTNLFVYVKKEL